MPFKILLIIFSKYITKYYYINKKYSKLTLNISCEPCDRLCKMCISKDKCLEC